MTKSLFSATGLSCVRGGRMLFQNLTLDVQKGAAVMLTGPNGSGKTTLLEIMAGLRAAQGDIARAGAGGGACAFLPAQDTDIHPLHTVEGHLRFWADILRVAEIAPALAAFGLTSVRQTRTANLSQGQRRRLGLARMYLNAAAPLWLLDEPFNALDTDTHDILCRHIATHCAAGGAVVAASHIRPDNNLVAWQEQAVGA